MAELIAQGQNISDLPKSENEFAEGDEGEVRLYLTENISEEQLQKLQDDILEKRVKLTEEIKQDARIVVIKFRKEILALGTIAIAALVIVGLIIAWQLLKAAAAIPIWVWALGGIGLGIWLLKK